MTVNIPFAFAVEDHSLPAGEYFVLTVTPERSIRIVSANGKHSAIVNTLPNYAKSPSETSRLVFHRYGDEYFLAQVWTGGQNVARNPLSSKRAMEIASSGGSPRLRRSSPSPQPTKFCDVLELSGAPTVAPVFVVRKDWSQ